MYLLRGCRFAVLVCLLLSVAAWEQDKQIFTSPLPTGVRLDPVGEGMELGSLRINLIVAPSGDKVVVVLSGWREQGIQIVDLKTRMVTQTLLQDGAFYGAAFAPDGRQPYPMADVEGRRESVVFTA